MFWLGVLVVVALTAWRLLANLKSLAGSLSDLSERLTPALTDLAAKSEEVARRAAGLSARAERAERDA